MHSRCQRYGQCGVTWEGARELTFDIGNLRQLNELGRNAKADYIIHTGDFGFYDDESLNKIAEK